tara:strand:+ start:4311 stop:5987 length:1677 start_codon:yes stop_codon:yes gene_type:complete
MSAWVYGGGGGGTPGGPTGSIQFNSAGSFSGSTLLSTNGAGSLSASVNISASAFYGDGSNLTGLTASAVNVADGPEFSLQFRRDSPISGEISGSANFSVSSDRTKLFVSGTTLLSASTPNGQDIFVGSGTTRTIGTLIDGSDDFFVMGHDDGAITLSASNGVEFVGGSDGVGSFGSPVFIYTTQEGSTVAAKITQLGEISASTSISASEYYIQGGNSFFFGSGDAHKITRNGTNLDINSGGKLALQGGTEVSASTNLSASNLYSTTLNLTSDAVVEGQVKVGPGTGVGYVASNGDPDTRIRFGAAGRGSDSISIEAGGKSFIILDENGQDELILGAEGSDVVYVSGSLTASVGMRVSASAAIGEDIFVGSGTSRTIGTLIDGGDFFVIGHDAGSVTLSASAGVEFVASTSDGVSAFGCPINVFDDQAGSNTVVSLSKDGDVSGSGNLTAKGNVTFGVSDEKTANFNIQNFRTFIVNSTGSAITGSLPGVTSAADVGLTYTVKDIAGSGSTNNVVVAASGSQKIDGATQAKIQTDYGALTITAFSSSMGGFGWGITSTT